LEQQARQLPKPPRPAKKRRSKDRGE
jgi:hypothetical protein